MNTNDNPTWQVLKGHASVRDYLDKPVSDDLVTQLVECGQRASTSSNMQTTSVVHVADPDLKKELAVLSADQRQIHDSGAFLVFCADLHRDYLAWKLRGGDRFDGNYAEALLVSTVDAALFMQNVAVAAEAVGLGICMIGAIRNSPADVGRLLGLPSYVYAVAGFTMGWPAVEPGIKPRLPLGAVLHTNRYKADDELIREIEAYDQAMVEFYGSQGMHERDQRWTTVMSKRTGRFHQRELEPFLEEQGFGWQNGKDPA